MKESERPGFALMRQDDVQSFYHLQMPRWLFSDPRYASISLEAKMVYTFLLNRFQLSRMNGWVNEYGEVFVIFPRKALAEELRVCEQRITASFKVLTDKRLIWEKRCGRGDANQIYLASVQPVSEESYECAPFVDGKMEETQGSRTSDSAVLGFTGKGAYSSKPQEQRFKTREIPATRPADFAVLEQQDLTASKKEKRDTDLIPKEVSQSMSKRTQTDWQAAEEELEEILEGCELYAFEPEVARVFENAVERLFYSESFRLGKAVLPQCRVRAKLHLLDGAILREAESKLHANLERNVKNSTAYTMAAIFNCIAEAEGDLLVDPYLNSLRIIPGRCGP